MRKLGLIGGLGPGATIHDYFERLIELLASGGAELAAISAVTPHICIPELQRISALPLVNIMEETAAEIRARGYKRVALFRHAVRGRILHVWHA
jgi:aspartate/glutamate racemase